MKNRVKHANILSQQPIWEDLSNPATNPIEQSIAVGLPKSNPLEEKAKLLAEEMVKDVREEAYNQGFHNGKEEGMTAGKELGRSEIEPQTKLLQNLIQSFQDEKKSFYQENEVFIVKLAVEIAKKIIRRELKQTPEILIYVVREALRQITHSGRITIKVNPDDIKLFDQFRSVIKDQIAAFENVDFIPSDEILAGGCFIESESGIVDAQLDVQLKKIEESLLEGGDV